MTSRQDTSDNPFADPAAVLETGRTPNHQPDPATIETSALSEYNPFGTDYHSLDGQISSHPGLPPPYSAFEAQRATEELERRQKMLDAKAAELAQREEQYRLAAQSRLAESGGTKNWPPLPSFLPCKPCFYLDIEAEIIPGYQKMVKIGYYLWLSYAALLCANLFGGLIYFAGTDRFDGGSLFGVAILVCILCIPASFLCWFRPLYKAFKSNSSINFFIFFFVFGAQILVMIIQSLGIRDWGSCGWIAGLAVVKSNPAIGGIVLVIACLFTGLTVASAFYLIQVHHIYRTTGASFGKAREEFARGVVSDPTVRATAVEAGLYATRQSSAGSN